MDQQFKTYIEYRHFRHAYDPIILNIVGSDELVERWWVSPNRAFDMETPETASWKNWRKVADYIHEFEQY